MEVRIHHLRPRQVEAAMAKRPVLFQPLGTVEWHGKHNILGLDAVKVYQLCIRAAQQGGGLVAPPFYGGMGGLDQPYTFVIEPENSLVSHFLQPWLERLCFEAIRNGFKAVVLLTGHYGASQQIVVRETAVRMTRTLNRPILGTPEYFLALDEDYVGDHAAFFETSIMMHLLPDSVDLNELGSEPHQGVHGRDPKAHANARDGQHLCDAIVSKLVQIAEQMPDWDEKTMTRFADAESALVEKQIVMASRSGNSFEAWRHVGEGALATYPQLLVSRRFEDIVALVEKL